MMLRLPMEVVAPVVGIAAVILSVAAGIVMVRFFTSKFPHSELKPGAADQTGRDRMLQEVQSRLGELDHLTQRMDELEERVDFAERLLAQPREGPRLGPPPQG